MQSQQIIFIGIAVIVSGIAGVLIGSSMTLNQDVQSIENQYAWDANTVYEKLQNNEIFVVDIRDESEYSEGHIVGSSIDYLYGDTLDKRISTIQKKLPGFTSDKKLVLVDNDGVHAKYIAKKMSNEGIETYFLEDGLDKWDKELTSTSSAKTINSEELFLKISTNEDLYLLDVREPAELEVTKIDSSVNVPLSKIFEVNGMDDIPTDKPVVVICGSGNRATIATYAMAQNNIDFQVLEGGIKAWDVYENTSELDKLFEKMDGIHMKHQFQMSEMWQSMDETHQQKFLEKMSKMMNKMENMDMSEHMSGMGHEGMDHGGMDHSDMDCDGMKHEGMDHDDMKHDSKSCEGMNHDDMDHDKMNHDDMDHDKMNHDDMDHDKMNHDDMDCEDDNCHENMNDN